MNDAPNATAPAPALTPSGDDPAEKPYPGYARELAALEKKVSNAQRAASEPFPGPLKDAFVSDPPVVCGFTLQPVRMSHVQVLKKIKSPLLAVMRILREELSRADGRDESTAALAQAARLARVGIANERIAKEIVTEDETMSGTIFCFVRPLAEVRALLKKGLVEFEETAIREIADTLRPDQVAELQRAVSFHYSNSFATAIRYEAPASKTEGDGTVFTLPPAEPTMTGSVGGSPSSAR